MNPNHSTPADAVKERVRETVIVGVRSDPTACGKDSTPEQSDPTACGKGSTRDWTFRLERPADTDHLFDHPAVRAAYGAREYVPYWAELWPAARMLAKAVLREPWEARPDYPPDALEIACGLGLAGIAGLARGLRVTFSDLDDLAVSFAAANARLNGFREFRTAAIDLRFPPARRFPVILGSDLMYDAGMAAMLADFLAATLETGGLALIADPDREAGKPFRHELWKAGLAVEPTFARAGVPGGERTKGTIYRVTRPAGG